MPAMQSDKPSLAEIPELLTLVAYELDIKERYKLMLVSKSLFHLVGPTIWRILPRFEYITSLFEGARVEHGTIIDKYIGIPITGAAIVLPPEPDLGRYRIYAPWVQELSIFEWDHLEVENLDQLMARLDRPPLLSNLQRLTIGSKLTSSNKEIIKLIDALIGPSLLEIRTNIVRPRIGIRSALTSRISSPWVPALLKRIQGTCPHIRALEFYPEIAHDESEDYTPSEQCHRIISSFLHLRSFSSNTYILGKVTLGILGELPYLESLGIRGRPGRLTLPVLEKAICIPDSWFPSLKELRLYDAHPDDVQVLWNQPTISKKLVVTLVHFYKLYADNPGEANRTGWVAPFLDSLCDRSPHLIEVDIRIWANREIPQALCKYFSRVPNRGWVYQWVPRDEHSSPRLGSSPS